MAEKARVAIATVSNVINGTKGTRADTKGRVLDAIRELGYSQNQTARDLARGQSTLLGMIISDIRNPFFPEITASFQDQALARYMDVMVLNTNYDADRTYRCVRRLIGMRVPARSDTHLRDRCVDNRQGSPRLRRCTWILGGWRQTSTTIVVDYEHGIAERWSTLPR